MIYAQIENDEIIAFLEQDDPPDGVGTFTEVATKFTLGPPTQGFKATLVNGVPTWVDTRTLEDLRSIKNDEINSERLIANRSSFTFTGKLIACDELSRSDIDGANGIISLTGALPPGWPGAWKALDNTYVSIPDVATWTTFYGSMVSQGTTNFLHAQALKAYMNDAARTAEEIQAIHWGMVL